MHQYQVPGQQQGPLHEYVQHVRIKRRVRTNRTQVGMLCMLRTVTINATAMKVRLTAVELETSPPSLASY